MRAPLAANRNDKGCAFGGSLASLMTLAGWGVALLHLAGIPRPLPAVAGKPSAVTDSGEKCRLETAGAEIYVQDSRIEYLAPVWETLDVRARLDGDDDGAAFVAAFAARGKARAAINARCRLADGAVAATLAARFVAIDPTRAPRRS